MRRVIDDSHYEEVRNAIMDIVLGIPACDVSEYSYGSYRARAYLVRNYVQNRLDYIRFGKCEHAYGIGNNHAWEIIYLGEPEEEQICGLFHATDDGYGTTICWVSDYDETTSTQSRHIRGTERSK